ncbi:MAG: hypothetical protein AAGB11_08690 [Pseudomonadota bacterium]
MSGSLLVLFIVGKAMIWLLFPLLFFVMERRWKRRMGAKAGDAHNAGMGAIPAWLRADREGRLLERRVLPVRAPAPVRARRGVAQPQPQQMGSQTTAVQDGDTRRARQSA